MRSALFTAIALIIATPTIAAAQSTSEAQQDVQGMADRLNDPSTQAAMAGALGAVMAAMLDIRVDKMAKALEPLNGGKKLKMKGNTLREMAERQDPKFERKMEEGTKTAVRSAGSLAQALAVMLPELQKAAKKMGDALPNLQ
ncbi:MAG: hypothetical protein AABY88_06480 [Pseudomonadota bacterium]